MYILISILALTGPNLADTYHAFASTFQNAYQYPNLELCEKALVDEALADSQNGSFKVFEGQMHGIVAQKYYANFEEVLMCLKVPTGPSS